MMRALRCGMMDAAGHWPSALFLFAAVSVPAGLAGYVFHGSLLAAFGRSAALETLSTGFSYTTFFDLFAQEGYRITPVMSTVAGFLIMSIPLHAFLAAGLVSALRRDRAWSARAFFEGAAKNSGGFLLLSLMTLGLVLPIAAATLAVAGYLVSETGTVSDLAALAPLILGALAIACIVTLGDFARISFVHDQEKRLFWSIRDATGFLSENAGEAASLLFVLTIASLLPLLGVILFEGLVPLDAGGWLVPLVLVQQAAVMLRSWVRVLSFAAESSLLRNATGTLRPGSLPSTPSPLLSRGI